MYPRITPASGVVLLALALCSAGCSQQKPSRADPEQAREALRVALDGWKSGESLDSLRSAKPSIQVADPDWSAGATLVRYEIAEGEKHSGYDLHIAVTLWTKVGSGREKKQKATYAVGTSPGLAVVRYEGF
jgi:hypothetical protein